MSKIYDVAIVGGGIVGLASARSLLERDPGLKIVVLEKEPQVASHQTGNNSGVIHAGIYYKPRSLKANLCVAGARLLRAFCDQHGIAYELCGKAVVATEERELEALEELYRRGTANGVPGLRKVDQAELRAIEPHVNAIAGLHSPQTGIVNYKQVAAAMVTELRTAGAEVLTGAQVLAIHPDGSGVRLQTPAGEVAARFVINCAGLYSDKIARMMGIDPDVQIIPFRGEYYFLKPERQDLVRGLIYPVPDARFPFLGVHFTRTVEGKVEAGPNAVLAFAREGYTKGTIRPGELWETLRYGGFHRMARKYWRVGMYEVYRSFSREAFVRALQRLVPDVRSEDVVPGGAGVRAQAVTPAGALIDDFKIMETDASIHVLNAPSPAATASLAIGGYVADLALSRFTRAVAR
jgi:L-2-hydroxyglutarate oxidase